MLRCLWKSCIADYAERVKFMRKTKKLFALVTVIILCMTLTSCATSEPDEYIIPEGLSSVQSDRIAQNDSFVLEWDDSVKCALLRSKITDYVWLTTPYGAYSEHNESIALNSVLYIEYYDLTDSSMQTEKSYTCVSDGNVSSQIIDNGVCVTYFFSEAEVTVPVYFTLDEGGLRVTVKAKEIVESGKTKLIAVSLVPYLCSAENVQDKSAYLFIPTGSGALMYTDNEVSKSARLYSGEVYGTDGARHLLDDTENEEAITAPVFGVKKSDGNAMFAIIDEGSEAARIDAAAGSARYGYSNVCASFLVRGYDEIEQIIGTKRSDALALAETWSKTAVYSVCYYPLYGDKADYNGMAEFYRDYLVAKGDLIKSGAEQQPYQLEIVGGAQTKRFFLGIPYNSVISLTSFKEALEIIEEMKKSTSVSPGVVLSGYGDSGADVGKTAGGYGFSSVFGNKKDRKKLEEYCADNGINLFTDFELVYYSKSGKGFSTLLDTAKTANRQSAAFYPLKINIRIADEENVKIRLLKRKLLNKAVEKLIDWADDDFLGIGLGSLASVAYSDYSDESTYMKDGTEEQVKELVQKTKNAGYNVLLRSANAYAAGIAHTVTDVSLSNGNYAVFDEYIPFYQMVFGGYTALYSTPVNYSADQRNLLLRAVSSGTSPKYLVVKNHNSDVSDSKAEYFYATEYENIKENIVNAVNETGAYYEAVKDAGIVRYAVISESVSKTEFDNGVTVYVNYSDSDLNVEGYSVSAKSFVYIKNN